MAGICPPGSPPQKVVNQGPPPPHNPERSASAASLSAWLQAERSHSTCVRSALQALQNMRRLHTRVGSDEQGYGDNEAVCHHTTRHIHSTAVRNTPSAWSQ
ncbi:unnamed protein product [Peniophora sp. CBMAI 1063]|nr:unnamed protein product [Peniophora sp. CBMAI 1063]